MLNINTAVSHKRVDIGNQSIGVIYFLFKEFFVKFDYVFILSYYSTSFVI